MRTTDLSTSYERDTLRRRLMSTAACLLAGVGVVLLGRQMGFEGGSLDLFALAVGAPIVIPIALYDATRPSPSRGDRR